MKTNLRPSKLQLGGFLAAFQSPVHVFFVDDFFGKESIIKL